MSTTVVQVRRHGAPGRTIGPALLELPWLFLPFRWWRGTCLNVEFYVFPKCPKYLSTYPRGTCLNVFFYVFPKCPKYLYTYPRGTCMNVFFYVFPKCPKYLSTYPRGTCLNVFSMFSQSALSICILI